MRKQFKRSIKTENREERSKQEKKVRKIKSKCSKIGFHLIGEEWNYTGTKFVIIKGFKGLEILSRKLRIKKIPIND